MKRYLNNQFHLRVERTRTPICKYKYSLKKPAYFRRKDGRSPGERPTSFRFGSIFSNIAKDFMGPFVGARTCVAAHPNTGTAQ